MIFLIVSFFLFVGGSESTDVAHPHGNITHCFHRLITHQYNSSYNYLQLSNNVGGEAAYPGFASFYMHLSDEAMEKAHQLTKYAALRRFEPPALIDATGRGMKISSTVQQAKNVPKSLMEAQHQNELVLLVVRQCHERASEADDAHVQHYLESNVFDHHIELDKRLSDYRQRVDAPKVNEQTLLIEMLDDELLAKHGDLRADLFK